MFLRSLSPSFITLELKFQHMSFGEAQTLSSEARLLQCGRYGGPCAHRQAQEVREVLNTQGCPFKEKYV